MIPAFLRSLAVLVRQLIEAGKAVHVTLETARDLELLAGLPWDEAKHKVETGLPGKLIRSVSPADLALGWLLASRAQMRNQDAADGSWYRVADEDDTQRAAACAELAVIAVTAPGPWYLLSDPASMHTRGTREGAQAAWGFIVEQINGTKRPTKHHCPGGPDWWAIVEPYERELEAMK